MPAHAHTGARLIDCDHRALEDLFTQLDHNLAAGTPITQIAIQLAAIRQLTLTHFALEESIMQSTKFPGLELHRLEHQWLAEQTASLAARARQQQITNDDMLLKYLVQTHRAHIRHRDRDYGDWLHRTQPAPPPASADSHKPHSPAG